MAAALIFGSLDFNPTVAAISHPPRQLDLLQSNFKSSLSKSCVVLMVAGQHQHQHHQFRFHNLNSILALHIEDTARGLWHRRGLALNNRRLRWVADLLRAGQRRANFLHTTCAGHRRVWLTALALQSRRTCSSRPASGRQCRPDTKIPCFCS